MSSLKRMRITVEGKTYDVAVEMLEEASAPTHAPLLAPRVEHAAPTVAPAVSPASSLKPATNGAARQAGAITCPLSGMVISVDVQVGQQVKSGDVLVTLEAMKMKTPVRATVAGTIKSIEAKPGIAVEEGAVLLVLG
ncbi:MAG TPA: biotin/lipoyl-containing protein [Myxococcales bacterium]|jgi:biotin carboxyl carrier protein